LALYAANVCASVEQGIARAAQALESGQARARLGQLVSLTQQLAKA
jgi:anthranilate phosphoribosyltransferase